MRTLHIIMPMAGEGSRFLKEGWTTPKPLIELDGIPLFKRAISSVAMEGITMKYSFIVRQEHIDKYSIDSQILEILPEANIFAVQQTTRGAVETCLIAKPNISDEDGVIVMDCDLEFRSKGFNQMMTEILNQNIDTSNGGLLVSFESDNPRYSYAQTDSSNRVIRTAEKEVISNHALCGAYFFASGKLFKKVAHQLMNETDFSKPEYYVSLLYNYILAEGLIVRVAPMEIYHSYGTPEELKQYIK